MLIQTLPRIRKLSIDCQFLTWGMSCIILVGIPAALAMETRLLIGVSSFSLLWCKPSINTRLYLSFIMFFQIKYNICYRRFLTLICFHSCNLTLYAWITLAWLWLLTSLSSLSYLQIRKNLHCRHKKEREGTLTAQNRWAWRNYFKDGIRLPSHCSLPCLGWHSNLVPWRQQRESRGKRVPPAWLGI